uniref:Uncharacterized protein n=1 Tax=Ascaris lumbricoides TaxID=6252 RepID=A0A0M3IHT6_ASCLU
MCYRQSAQVNMYSERAIRRLPVPYPVFNAAPSASICSATRLCLLLGKLSILIACCNRRPSRPKYSLLDHLNAARQRFRITSQTLMTQTLTNIVPREVCNTFTNATK